MRITKWGEYGILFSIYLAKRFDNDGPVGAPEIAARYDVPLQYTQQILHRLKKGNVITSTRGPKGGFHLTKTPIETSLGEILRTCEGSTFDTMCEAHPLLPECNHADMNCSLKAVWIELQGTINKFLESKSLADLLDTESGDTLIEGPHRRQQSL